MQEISPGETVDHSLLALSAIAPRITVLKILNTSLAVRALATVAVLKIKAMHSREASFCMGLFDCRMCCALLL